LTRQPDQGVGSVEVKAPACSNGTVGLAPPKLIPKARILEAEREVPKVRLPTVAVLLLLACTPNPALLEMATAPLT